MAGRVMSPSTTSILRASTRKRAFCTNCTKRHKGPHMIVPLLLAAACSGDCKAESLFQAMERKLLSQLPAVQLEVTSHAEGAIKADAVTDVSVGPATRLHSKGSFLGKNFEKNFDQPTTPGLRDAVLLGMTRMGLLHNVANLTQDLPPDHADKDVREWLKAVKFKRAKGGVSYSINLDGIDRGETTLVIDSKTKLPKKRTALIHFPQGEMRVTETYRYPVKK